MEDIENIELEYLKIEDYEELKEAMIESYSSMPDLFWKKHHIQKLITIYPEGQVVIKINNQIAGCALSIIVDYNKLDNHHTYKDITGNDTFSTHKPDGDVIYGIDVFIRPKFRGLRLGRRLYDYRKELVNVLSSWFSLWRTYS